MQTLTKTLITLVLAACCAAVARPAAGQTGLQPNPLTDATPEVLLPHPTGTFTADAPHASAMAAPCPPSCCCTGPAPMFPGVHRCCHRVSTWWHDTFFGYPEYFHQDGFGSAVDANLDTQIGKGQAAQLMLYQYDFGQGKDAARLNIYGQKRLKKMVPILCCCAWPLMIEESLGNDPLNEARRLEVLRELGTVAPELAVPDRVLVMGPATPGINGIESVIVHDNMLRQTLAGPFQTSTISGGSFSGSLTGSTAVESGSFGGGFGNSGGSGSR